MKAQVSITCVPWVFIILSIWPVERGIARPWRAGMVVGAMFNISSFKQKVKWAVGSRESGRGGGGIYGTLKEDVILAYVSIVLRTESRVAEGYYFKSRAKGCVKMRGRLSGR